LHEQTSNNCKFDYYHLILSVRNAVTNYVNIWSSYNEIPIMDTRGFISLLYSLIQTSNMLSNHVYD